MVTTTKQQAMPKGLRDTKTWYREVDPMSQVDVSLVDFVHQHGGKQLLDLGCGLGGYCRALADRGHTCQGLDISAEYVKVAKRLGVKAEVFDGRRIPLPDNSVDTVFMLEVLEHVENPASLLAEATRVAQRNVLASAPNCTQTFQPPFVTFSHMLELDHKNFFTQSSLAELLAVSLDDVVVEQIVPVDTILAKAALPGWLYPAYALLRRVRLVRPRYFFRLIARGKTKGAHS